MMTERLLFLLRCVTLVMLMSAASIFVARALAQEQTSRASGIVGTVADRTGNGIPEASVTMTNQETGAQQSTKTDDTGHFNFAHLKPGDYLIEAKADGFRPSAKNENIVSASPREQIVNLTLHDGYW